MRKYLILHVLALVIFLFASCPVFSQVQLNWGRHYPISGIKVNVMQIDDSSNIYLAGKFHNTSDFDPGADTFALTSNGAEDVFVMKVDSLGNLIWAKSFGGTSNDYPFALSLDENGDVVLGGYFRNTVDFNPGPAVYTATSSGFKDFYVLRLKDNGDFISALTIGGTQDEIIFALTIDTSSNVIVTGQFQSSSVDFDPSPTVFNLTQTGGSSMFLAKYSQAGALVWAGKVTAGSNITEGYAITSDTLNNIYVVGVADGYHTDFDMSTGFQSIWYLCGGCNATFIAKYDPSGTLIWAKGFDGAAVWESTPNDGPGYVIHLDKWNNIYLYSSFEYPQDVDLGTGTQTLMPVSGTSYNAYAAKYDNNGNLKWAKQQGSSSDVGMMGAVTDKYGKSYIATSFYGWMNVMLDGQSTVYQSTSQDAMVFHLDSAGVLLWYKYVHGIMTEYTSKLVVDKKNNVYVSGNFNDSTFFDQDTNFCMVPPQNEMFLVRYNKYEIPNSISTVSKEINGIRVFPNPGNDLVTVASEETIEKIELFDVNGRKVYGQPGYTTKQITIDCSAFAPSTYVLVIESNGNIFRYKLFVAE